MSSTLQAALEYFQITTYTNSMFAAGVIYDYSLTFSKEVNYIWCRSWTLVSTMFILVRYLGLCQALILGISYGQFFENSETVGTIFFLINEWVLQLFLAIADLVMILRVYAMWNRSRIILGVLLCIYVLNELISVVLVGIYAIPGAGLTVALVPLATTSYCLVSYNLPTPLFWTYIMPSFVLAAILLILAITQTFKQSLDMYKTPKRWQPNQYMRLLVRDGIVYYVIRSFFDVLHVIQYQTRMYTNVAMVVFCASAMIALYALLPRFMMNIRELYDRDTRRGGGIDTGFGVVSQSNVGGNAIASAIVFDVNATPAHDDDDIMEEQRGDSTLG